MTRQPLHVAIDIHADLDRVWELTQDTDAHARWDLRFSAIRPVEELGSGGYRFRYERRLGLLTLAGTGTSLGERHARDGSRTSALRFVADSRLSPLGAGRGYWRYTPTAHGVTFTTGYDYRPGWGRLLDALVLRRVIGWMTAWSFDRLRIWAETGVEPERWPLRSVLAVWRPDRPRAARCRRDPGRGARTSPATLDRLEAP
ncbi:SRPBCC family protein [Cellulomonas sp. ATA003]|uniref:SRPBCC family protein n=1 Tax=Cellulomonas sp. ATA003 TaxID=3073064 RepID=UPI002873BA87|nr:SRPBCC family protein [Cellulomonas sp. ATA003]WNB84586.1 SRPBCC family protein [Cellulomonas sp. ATA003]